MRQQNLQESKRRKLLLVDDDVLLRRCLRRAVESRGWHVTETDSVSAARLHLSEGRFDMVVTDLDLGCDEDGFVLLEYLGCLSARPRAILMTASDAEGLRAAASRFGSGFLRKPFSVRDFLRDCENWRQDRVGRNPSHGEFSMRPWAEQGGSWREEGHLQRGGAQ